MYKSVFIAQNSFNFLFMGSIISEMQNEEEENVYEHTLPIPEPLDDEEVCNNDTEMSKWGLMFFIGGCIVLVVFVFV